MTTEFSVRRALISVSDKTHLDTLAAALHQAGVEILSTGGTARTLRERGIAVTEVSDHTGFPEIMGGRVKTLHPAIHGGILARADVDDQALDAHGIAPIDLVVVNLYPFAATVARPGCSAAEAIEQIDIGGPAMLRAAAKNHQRVCVLCDPEDYATVIDGLPALPDENLRRELAVKAFAHTSGYDGQISQWLSSLGEKLPLPPLIQLSLDEEMALRYGENPHQPAGLYRPRGHTAGGLAGSAPLQGKPLSYNNLLDADAAWRAVGLLGPGPACVIVKHTNPCGAARAGSLEEAYDLALACDPTSAFGGIIACTETIDGSLAEIIIKRFYEVVIAPGFSEQARQVFAARPNLRLLVPGKPAVPSFELKAIDGGWLVQTPDSSGDDNDWQVVTRHEPDPEQWRDLRFAWSVVRSVRSNAIVYARNEATLGIGAGQMSRIDSARFAALKAADAGLSLDQSVMASEAFFPFADSIDTAAEHGISAIIQPGGSMRDEEVIAACDRHGIAMVLTGRRHFRH